MARKYSRLTKNNKELIRLQELGYKNIVLIGGRIVPLDNNRPD